MFFRYIWKHPLPQKDTLRTLLRRPLSWAGVLLYVLLCGILTTIYIGIICLNTRFLTTIPTHGGTIREGVIGAPRLINPVLATTETDSGLTKLLFSGLMKETVDGTVTTDLATRVDMSPDGLTYTFTLLEHLTWSDGKPLTSSDVVFTLTKRARFEANSYWQDVSVTNPDSQTVIISLTTPRSDLLKQTTLGIIPMHIWSKIPDEEFETSPYNLRPVGTGPFSFVRLTNQNSIVKEIILKRNRHYAGTKSFIDRYHVLFFANQEELARALLEGEITLTGAANPETAHVFESKYAIDTVASTKIVALFESKNTAFFAPQTLSILNTAIDKQSILATIEYGYGTLPDATRLSTKEAAAALQSVGYTLSSDNTLQKNGTPVAFSVAVANDPHTLAVAQLFSQELAQLGITAELKAFDPGRFQDILQNTEYQFFFGSHQGEELSNAYRPIITLYQSTYPLIHDRALHIPIEAPLVRPIDRYRESNTWYLRTNNVWKLFTNN